MTRMTNAAVLKKLNVTAPDDVFYCAIICEVMDDPVIDPTTLNTTAVAWLAASPEEKTILDCGNFKDVSRYDRRSLVRSINNGVGKSPNTRLPFTEQQLIPDTELKSKIDLFMRPHRIEIIKSDAEAEMQRKFFQKWLLFFSKSPKGAAIASVKPLLVAALNAVEDLQTIKDIVEKTSPKQLPILLSTSGTAAIEHLKHLDIQRTGTPLQMALYSDDEGVVAYLKTVMDPEEFERQSKEVFRNALPAAKQIELDTLKAPTLEYYNAMLIAQKAVAEKLCNDAFLFDAVNNRFTITDASIADFQQKLNSYVKNNPMHNPFILHRLYEIYENLPGHYAEDCLFSEKALCHAHALSSARWLQHYARGLFYLDGATELPLRSFDCRDSNPPVDVRSFIPSRLGVDSFVSIFGQAGWGGAAGPGARCARPFGNFCRAKTASFQNLLHGQREHAPRDALSLPSA